MVGTNGHDVGKIYLNLVAVCGGTFHPSWQAAPFYWVGCQVTAEAVLQSCASACLSRGNAEAVPLFRATSCQRVQACFGRKFGNSCFGRIDVLVPERRGQVRIGDPWRSSCPSQGQLPAADTHTDRNRQPSQIGSGPPKQGKMPWQLVVSLLRRLLLADSASRTCFNAKTDSSARIGHL